MPVLKIIIACAIFVSIIYLCISRVKESNSKKYRKNISSVQLDPDFEAMYKKLYEELSNSSYSKKVEKLKKTRDKCRILDNIIYFADIIVLIIVMWIVLTSKPEAIVSNIAILILMPLVLLLWTLLLTNAKSVYAKEYKNIVFSNFVKKVNNSKLEYVENDIKGYGAMKQHYLEILNPKSFLSNFVAQDYIMGFLDLNEKTPVKIGDLHVTETNPPTMSSRTNTFSGIFIVVEKAKPTAEEIRICVEGNKIVGNDKNITPEVIQKYMTIATTNQGMELSPAIKDVIMNFAIQSKIKFEIIIKENKVYFKFYTGNLFEPKIFGPTTDIKELILFYNIIKFAKKILPN